MTKIMMKVASAIIAESDDIDTAIAAIKEHYPLLPEHEILQFIETETN